MNLADDADAHTHESKLDCPNSMNAETPVPEGYVLHLPPLRHTFSEQVWVPASKSPSGGPQTERTCKVCGAVKVTLHGADHGRAWRRSANAAQIETFEAPVCVPIGGGNG